MGKESLLSDVRTYFFSTLNKTEIETDLKEFMQIATRLIGTYKDRNRLRDSVSQLVDMLNGYEERVVSYLDTLDCVQQGKATPEVVVVYDEMLMLYSILFCIYERLYGAGLEESFVEFMTCKGILSEEYPEKELSVSSGQEQVSLRLGAIVRGMIFDSYKFPLALRILATSSEIKSICGSSFQVRIEELELEIKKFADRLICLAGIRNQISHMGNVLECYSTEEKKLRRSFTWLASFFPRIQSDMCKLFEIFHSMLEKLYEKEEARKAEVRSTY